MEQGSGSRIRTEWDSNRARRAKLAAVVLAPDENGRPPDCALCGMPGADSVDHILPQSKYPELTWELHNLQPAHRGCNSSKGSKTDKPAIGNNSRQW